MAYSVKILPTAWEDLKKIEDWHLVQFGADTALKVSTRILDVVKRLEQYPDSGSQTPDQWLNEQGYRMIICDKHIAVYKQIDTTIFIHHIADTQTEYTKLFY